MASLIFLLFDSIRCRVMQTNESNGEILNTIKYVRPGKVLDVGSARTKKGFVFTHTHIHTNQGFECNFDLFAKTDVNGANEMKLFTFLKKALPTPSGAKVQLLEQC